MAKKQTDLRIRGLVRLMNRTRDRLRSGVPADEAASMRDSVENAVRTVERLCRQHRTTPDALPTPSHRAYVYLLDLLKSGALEPGRLPIQSDIQENEAAPPSSPFRVSGIVSTSNYYHRQFEMLVDQALAGKKPIVQADIDRLAARMRTETEAIKALCEDSGSSPADLPVPSRHSYQWLRYLSDPKHLASHLRMLKEYVGLGREQLRKAAPRTAQATLHVRVYNTRVLYQTQIKGHAYHVTINEGLVGAPRRIVKALVHATLRAGDHKPVGEDPLDPQAILKTYCSSEAFAAIHADLDATVAQPAHLAIGQYHDLNAAFARVNTAYFDGKLARPHLQWNRTRTQRKLGHYDVSRDTVMVSQTLDAPSVPDYVIDFVVYHELLHKTLGTPTVNGRRRAHTPEFREAERAFIRYEEARKFINNKL